MEELDILAETKPVKVAKKLAVSIKKKPEPEPESESEEEPETPVVKPEVKPKKERTARQIEAFNECLAKKKEKADKRFADAKKLAEYEKKELEEKVVKKAISIKKKQIKKQSALDDISDDDTPMEKIKQIAKPKPVVPVKAEAPKITFKFI
jgi:hypothetical protein